MFQFLFQTEEHIHRYQAWKPFEIRKEASRLFC